VTTGCDSRPEHLPARGQGKLAKAPANSLPTDPDSGVDFGVRKTILLYGLLGGLLIAALQLIEYRWLVLEHSVAIYGGLVAALFAAVGIWLGRRITHPKPAVVIQEVLVPAPSDFVRDDRKVTALGLTPRELEILELIAAGLSNREIGERVHVSENTVKTHSSRVFAKLGAQRRTQAVQLGKELRLIP
jgi:NarL family two-component system response regulator LiaR